MKLDKFSGTGLKVLFLRGLSVLLQFITLYLITNHAAEDLVGKYNYLNSTIIIIGSIAMLGLNNSFLQFTGILSAENKVNYIKKLYAKKMIILITSTVFFSILFYFLAYIIKIPYFKDETILELYKKVIILLFPYIITQFNYQVIRGIGNLFLSEVFRNIFRFGGFLIFISVLVFYNQIDFLLEALIVLFVVLALLSTLVIILKLRKLIYVDDASFTIGYKKILITSLPMTISFVALQIMQGVDIFFLERYSSLETVAYYGVAVKISTVIAIILTSVNAIIAPQISSLFFKNELLKLKALMKKATFFTFILSTPLILTLILLSSYILSYFGENYLKANMALIIILLGQVFNAFCGSVGVYLNMTGRQKTYQIILLTALIINVILNAILIPKYNMEGAAISTAASLVFWNICACLVIYKKDKVNTFITSKFYK